MVAGNGYSSTPRPLALISNNCAALSIPCFCSCALLTASISCTTACKGGVNVGVAATAPTLTSTVWPTTATRLAPAPLEVPVVAIWP